MNFEVHVEDLIPGSTDGIAADWDDVPESLRAALEAAVAAVGNALNDARGGRFSLRIAVSGHLNAPDAVDPRQADAVHVSVYLGPEVEEPEKDTLAGGDALPVSPQPPDAE